MSAEMCQSLISRLEAKPAYLGKDQIESIMAIKVVIEKQLDDLQLEGLLVRFRQLDVSLQKEFIKLVNAEIN
ncbi:hypothetical protein QUF76_09300 [Desulfobacterales bacterium HSG16]|nr:hypothetical protein [Desulfobacterales bacterium HSG16]